MRTRVRTIGVSGNSAFSERDLLRRLSLKESSPFSLQQLSADAAALARWYREQGYYFARVEPAPVEYTADSSFVEITLAIDEGPLATIATLGVEGNTLFTAEEILREFDTRAGKILDPQILERDIDALLTRYERVGYPFASVRIAHITPAVDSVQALLDVLLNIDEGARVHIGELQVKGNTETRDHVIIREAGIREGELYDEQRVERVRRRLNRMNIFSSVSEPELYLTEKGGGLLLTVREGRTNTFDGILGYVPGSGAGETGYLTGLVTISMRNLFGTARKLNIQWQQFDRRTQEIALRYVEPWLFNLPLDLGAGFQQRQQDTIYVRRVLDVRSDVRLSDVFTLGGIIGKEDIIPSATAAQAISSSTTLSTGLDLRVDTRDDLVSPTGGMFYRNEYQIGTKNTSGARAPSGRERTTVQKISLDAEFYREVFPRQVAAFGLHWRQRTGDNLEQGDLYRFGGATTLRGYRESQFSGSRVAWGSAEYRVLLARRSFFYGFLDAGYYFLPGNPALALADVDEYKYGYGIGLRMETGLGNIGVSFALGEGDTFSQGKIHVGLINEF